MSDIPSIAPLRNVAALHTLVERLINRGAETGADLPGMATFYGPSGDGKSTAGIYVRNRFDAVLVQCKSTWTKASLCRAILTEMGLPPTGTIDAMAERITEALAISDRCLIVDEADFLVQRRMIEVLRDIYEGSKAPVILIGEEGMPQKLRAWLGLCVGGEVGDGRAVHHPEGHPPARHGAAHPGGAGARGRTGQHLEREPPWPETRQLFTCRATRWSS